GFGDRWPHADVIDFVDRNLQHELAVNHLEQEILPFFTTDLELHLLLDDRRPMMGVHDTIVDLVRHQSPVLRAGIPRTLHSARSEAVSDKVDPRRGRRRTTVFLHPPCNYSSIVL